MAHESYAQVVERVMQRVVYDAPRSRRGERGSTGTGPWQGGPTHRNETTFNEMVARVEPVADRMFESLAGSAR